MRLSKGRKAKQQVIHAQRRIGERLGIAVTKRELVQLADDIRGGKLHCCCKQSNRRYLYDHTMAGTPVQLVYDRFRRTVVTVLFDRNPNRVEVISQ